MERKYRVMFLDGSSSCYNSYSKAVEAIFRNARGSVRISSIDYTDFERGWIYFNTFCPDLRYTIVDLSLRDLINNYIENAEF